MLGVSIVGAGVYVSRAESGQKKELDSLELELQVFMIQPVSESESGFLQGQCESLLNFRQGPVYLDWPQTKVSRLEPGLLPGQSRLSHITVQPGRVPEMYEYALDS